MSTTLDYTMTATWTETELLADELLEAVTGYLGDLTFADCCRLLPALSALSALELSKVYCLAFDTQLHFARLAAEEDAEALRG